MDTSKLRPVRISPYAREKIISDFFPDIAEDMELYENQEYFNFQSSPLHAGALCLYATTLITKVHESSPLELEPYYKEREQGLKSLIQQNPKFSHLTSEEVSNFVKNLIIKDIRNSFAHGNFEISYDIYTKKLYFVLHPQRKDFICQEPIIISKNSLLKANKKFVNQLGSKYLFFNDKMLQNEINNNLNNSLKKFMWPTQMLKLSEYYLESNKAPTKAQVLFDEKLYYLIDYALLSTKITYEQDDYYNIFGKNSNIFDTISLVRNSLAHDNYEFLNNAKQVNYQDKNRSITETIGESAIKLLIVDSQKQILKNITNDYSIESVSHLADKFKDIFDFFFGGRYTIEQLVSVFNNQEDTDSESSKG